MNSAPGIPQPAGTWLLTEGVVADALLKVVQGEVSVWRDGRLLGFRDAPVVLSPDTGLLRRPSRVGVRAEGPVRVRRLPIPDDVSEHPWVSLLADELAVVDAARLELVRGHDDFWEQPNARLVPGPYAFGPFRAALLVVAGPAGHVRSLLPPGLHPLPGLGDRYLLVLAQLERVRTLSPRGDGRTWRYRETTPLLPCWCERGPPGAYVPELYPDAILPTLLGREIYGFPKRVARTRMDDTGVDVITEHTRILRARWGGHTPASAEDLAGSLVGGLAPWAPTSVRSLAASMGGGEPPLPVPVYVRDEQLDRRVLEPRTLRTDQLVRIPFRFLPVTEVRRIEEPEVRFAADHPVLAGTVLQAWSVRTGFRFGRSTVVKDYRRSLRARWARQ